MTDTIAIVGMACRFPGGVDSPEAYWHLLREGADAIGEIPRDRWSVDEFYDPDPSAPGKMYVRHGCFIRDADMFDADFFGITPREAASLDPQQRLLLEVTWESLERAGLAPSTLRGSDTGVFVGMSWDDATQLHDNHGMMDDIDPYSTLGSARSIAAGRIAYVLDLHGPVVQLDTACSSSLVSVYQACQSLQMRECDLALAGGVNLMLSPATMVALCKLTALAPDGRGKTFDAAADGYVRGEGCGMVVLKRMSDAVRDGDTILARICSAAVNHDGASNGLTAPNGQAQQRLMRKALHKAGLAGHEVAYVEAHGTGTELGDPIELAALNAIYGEHRSPAEPLCVGSAKSNIGHLEAAAGIAGLLKVVLMLRQGEIPPQPYFNVPNPHLDWDAARLTVPTKLLPWPSSGARRLAAVSAFGFSGTNAHLIVEGMPVRSLAPPETRTRPATLHCLPLSAHSGDALKALTARYVEHLAAHPDQRIEDICFTAATARDHAKHRLMIIAASRDELLAELRAYTAGGDTSQTILGNGRVGREQASNKLGFLFTGQGTQYAGMGRELYDSQPVFREAIKRCGELLQGHMDRSLVELLYGESSSAQLLDRTGYTQPVLFALQYALVELWKSWGVRPDAVIGHSLGEYAAACAAGVFGLEAGLQLVATRGRLMDALPHSGTMAVVMANESRVQQAIAPFGNHVSIASINGPDTVVISGQRDSVQQVLAKLTAEGLDTEMLNTSNAGHSELIDPMLEPFRCAAEQVSYAVPRIAMISNVSGRLAAGDVACGAYWVQHARVPVRFADGMNALAGTGCGTFIEIGPNPNLLAMGMACVNGQRPRPKWLPSLTKDRSGSETMLYSLAKLYVAGAEIDWQGFHSRYNGQRVSLPTYPFQRVSYPVRAFGPAAAPDQNGKTHAMRDELRANSRLPSPLAVAATLDDRRTGLEDESRALTPRLDAAAILFAIDALEQLGFAWHVGAKFSEVELGMRIPEPNRPKVSRVLSRLVERGLLQHAGGQYHVSVARPVGAANSILDALQTEADYPECDLMRRAGSSLAAIWKGEVEPLSVLFPGGATDQAIAFYSRSRLQDKYNQLAGEVLSEVVSHLPATASMRVLEVGAGTGGLTSFLLPRLPADRCEYVFTDVSPLFLHAARERFQAYPFLQTGLLDVGKSPLGQGVERGSFDLIVAANVLHATPRLHDTLRHVRQLLKPGGWLMLLEAANPPLWGDTVFTLIDGWWNFEDRELRPDYPLMQRDRWARVLQEVGFDDVACLNDASFKDDSQHTLYLAQSNSTAAADAAESASEEKAARVSEPSSMNDATQPRVTLGDLLVDVFDQDDLAILVLNHAARVMRLKPEEIEPTQPLSELGLDSLMATELRAQLEHTLKRELSLNTLQMRRSIQEITAYVREDQTREDAHAASGADVLAREVNAPRAHLVPLQPKGNKTPLFFVPAGYGDLFAFQDIAHAIGMEQPVYGLQPASAVRIKTFRQMSIYRLVSAYIEEIKKVQPEGPYLLSGYSAGGIIVVELARELERQGNEVGLLVIFDPPSHVPFWLDWFYAANYRISVATGLIHVVRRLHSRFARRLFHTVLDEGLRTHTSVTREHRVAPYPGRITHFRARLSQSSLVSMKPIGRFWGRIAQQGLEEHWIPGTHYGMLRGPGASVVVDELRDCLQRAEASRMKK